MARPLPTNATPFYDASDNPTGCCPRFKPAGWDGARLHFEDKPFLRATTHSLAHIPLNMGKVFTRVRTAVTEAEAERPDQVFVLSQDLSPFAAEHLFAVDRPVPGEEMVTLSGDYLTKTFDGPYSAVRGWHADMQALARSAAHEPGAVYFHYTTCPKCQKAYGNNPVVGVVELKHQA